jgi:hypothetical protein
MGRRGRGRGPCRRTQHPSTLLCSQLEQRSQPHPPLSPNQPTKPPQGGYVLSTTSRCVEACVRALLGERPPPLAGAVGCAPSAVGWNTIIRTLAVHQHFWKSLGTVSLANTLAAASGARAAAAAGAPPPGARGAAALEALLAAAQADAAAAAEGEEELEEEEEEEGWEVDEDGEWEEDEGEGGGGGAVGPGEWAGESAQEMG